VVARLVAGEGRHEACPYEGIAVRFIVGDQNVVTLDRGHGVVNWPVADCGAIDLR
jgi:hypothetical protein